MKRLLMGLALSFWLAAPVALADVLALKEDHPKTYVVKRGDTLWSISSIFLEDPWLWPELWHYNQQLDDPHLIYPGDILYLIWVDGKPRLVKSIATKTIENRDVKLSPQMRIADLQQAIPAISLDVIGPFLSNSRVVDLDTLERAPYPSWRMNATGRIVCANAAYARAVEVETPAEVLDKQIALEPAIRDLAMEAANARTISSDEASVNARTLFEMGSMTKVFTGLLLADMVLDGTVSLDDPVESYLPDGATMPRRDGRQITLRNLSQQDSGLPRLPSPSQGPMAGYSRFCRRLVDEHMCTPIEWADPVHALADDLQGPRDFVRKP